MALEYSSIAWRSEASRVTHQPSHARPHAYYWPANSPYHERSMRCGSEAPGLWHGTRTSWYCRPWKRLLPRSLALTASCIAAPRCCSSSVSCGAAAASGFSAGVAQQGGAFAAVGDAAAFGARRRLELRYHAAPTAMVATPAATRRCLLEGAMARTSTGARGLFFGAKSGTTAHHLERLGRCLSTENKNSQHQQLHGCRQRRSSCGPPPPSKHTAQCFLAKLQGHVLTKERLRGERPEQGPEPGRDVAQAGERPAQERAPPRDASAPHEGVRACETPYWPGATACQSGARAGLAGKGALTHAAPYLPCVTTHVWLGLGLTLTHTHEWRGLTLPLIPTRSGLA